MGDNKYFPEFDCRVTNINKWWRNKPTYRVEMHCYVRFERDECWWEVEVINEFISKSNILIDNMEGIQRFLLQCRMVELLYIVSDESKNRKNPFGNNLLNKCFIQESEKKRLEKFKI